MKKQLAELGKKVISEKRAIAMAKTLFLDMDGEWSKFVKLERNFKKYKYKLPEKEQQRKKKLLEEFHKVFDEHCASEFGQRKIAQISAGILRKNEPIRQRYQELEVKIKILEASIQQETGIAEEVQFQSLVQDAGTRYRMVPQKEHGSGGGMTFATPMHQAHQIARVICDPNDVGVVNLVMRSKPDEPDEWSLMSEAEKDDLRNDTASLDRY